MKISGVYQIVNTITGDIYIGSSVDLKRRKRKHFNENTWKRVPNSRLYKDMKQYGKDNFLFRPVWLCNSDELKKYEQTAIDKYKPKYNIRNACTGMSKEEYQKQYNKQYKKEHADNIKQYSKQYYKENATVKKQYRKEHADSIKQYHNQKCLYKNELLTLNALALRLARKGIKHSTLEAKKYLVGE